MMSLRMRDVLHVVFVARVVALETPRIVSLRRRSTLQD